MIAYDGVPTSSLSVMEITDGLVTHETQYFAGLRELYETDEARALSSSPPKAGDLLALVDRVIAFTRAGIDGSSATPKKRTRPTSLTRGGSKRDP